MENRARRDSDMLTVEEVMSFTNAQLQEAKAYYEKKILEARNAPEVTSLVINNDVGSRNTPEIFKSVQLKPLVHNLKLINEAIANRESVINFMNTPDPDLGTGPSEPSNG